MPIVSKASSLPYGPLTDTAIHLCIDMQRMFADQTPWHVPSMEQVSPAIFRIARAYPDRTVFTRFIPPLRATDASGAWRRYYERWGEFTREKLAPQFLALLPRFLELIPPALVIDKRFYSPFTDPEFHQFLQGRHIDAIVVTGGETDVCVLATILDAVDLGYRVIVASDALCSVSDQAHENLLQVYSERFQQQIEVASAEAILDAWV